MTVEINSSAEVGTWCVVAALKSELSSVRGLHLRNVTLLETGVGPQNADRTLRAAFDKCPITGIIHVGFAGALSQVLQLGDVVIGKDVSGNDAKSTAWFASAGLSRLFDGDIRAHAGSIVTHDRILASAGEKRAAAAQHAGNTIACVDMESAPVAAICEERRIPYIGLRAITDTLDEELPLDLNECRGRDGNIDTMRVMWAAVHHPSTISGLVELRRRARDCAQTLAACVRTIISAYPTPEAYSNVDSS